MQADFVLYNGSIHTMDPSRPLAEAIAIAGRRILAVGDDEVRELLSPAGQALDLGGQTVLPAFTDCHTHFMSYALQLGRINLAGMSSKAAVLERVAARVAKSTPDSWLEGGGWDRNLWPGTQFPTRFDLDRVVPGRPVALSSKCGHVLWVSSRALEMAGVSSDTPDPVGGEIERDPTSGEPTGILKEHAIQLVRRVIPEPGPQKIDEAMLQAMACLQRVGVVGIHNCEGAIALSAFQRIADRGELGLRVLAHIPLRDLDGATALGLRTGFGNERLRLGAVKVFADGSLGARTAAMLESYESELNNQGIMVMEEKELDAVVRRACNAGIAPAVHAIGDRATRAVAMAYEASRQIWEGHGLRPRIEHAQVLTREDIVRLGSLGVVASVQPIHCTSDIEMVNRHWGARGVGAYAFRSLLNAGASLAFGSDCPVEDPNPLIGIHAAVTRRRADGFPCREGWHPEQRITVGEAVYAYTQGAAYASGEEHLKGSVSPGKLADLVVISKDIFALDPMDIPQAEVVATVIGGTVAYPS